MPLLQSIHLERVYRVMEFAFDTPKLQKIKLIGSPLRLHLVHGESVKRLLTDSLSDVISVKKMKNRRSLQTQQIMWLHELSSILMIKIR